MHKSNIREKQLAAIAHVLRNRWRGTEDSATTFKPMDATDCEPQHFRGFRRFHHSLEANAAIILR